MKKILVICLLLLSTASLLRLQGQTTPHYSDCSPLKFNGIAPAPWAIDGSVMDWQTLSGQNTSTWNLSNLRVLSNVRDDYNVYFYLRRHNAEASNKAFYFIDKDLDGLMEDGEPVIVINIQYECPAKTINGLTNLTKYLFVFTDARDDANIFSNGGNNPAGQGGTKGFIGDIAVDGLQATEKNSGNIPYKGSIYTNDNSLSEWQNIVNSNIGQASATFNQTSRLFDLETDLESAFAQINSLAVTPGFDGISPDFLNGLNTQNGIAQKFIINITSGFQVGNRINITGDANDLFIFRWDRDKNFSNGYNGEVKFQSGGAIVPLGGLKASNFIHVAGDINASSGGITPPAPYPQGPRTDNGTGSLINGGSDFNGGGFFTGYWLTTGAPTIFPEDGKQPFGPTSSLNNGIFVGGWYTKTTRFRMNAGTSGVQVACPAPSFSSHLSMGTYHPQRPGGDNMYANCTSALTDINNSNLNGNVEIQNSESTTLNANEKFEAAITENGYGVEMAIPWQFINPENKYFAYRVALQNGTGTYSPNQPADNASCAEKVEIIGSPDFKVSDMSTTASIPGSSYRITVTLENLTPYKQVSTVAEQIEISNIVRNFSPPVEVPFTIKVNNTIYGQLIGTMNHYIFANPDPINVITPQINLEPFGTGSFTIDITFPADGSVKAVKIEFSPKSYFYYEISFPGNNCAETGGGGGKPINPIGFDLGELGEEFPTRAGSNVPADSEKSDYTNKVIVYPNPSKGFTNIVLPDGVDAAEISVTDLAGKLIRRISTSGQRFIRIDNLRTGFYLLNLKTREGRSLGVKKIIIQ